MSVYFGSSSSAEGYKVIVLGNSCVGKTSVIRQLAYGTFSTTITTTISSDFVTKKIDVRPGRSLSLNIWDTAGQEAYRSLARGMYHEACVAVLVFDITSRTTFKGLESWASDLSLYAPEDLAIVVVGNKMDLIDREDVSPAEAQKFAATLNANCILVSAKTADGISELEKEIGECVEKVSSKRSKEKSNPIVISPDTCLLYTSPSPRDLSTSRMPSSA
eukprot:TRINITY_DN59826_c0_g1_i1.p1 TRINITY_DN59826_c0_g1~~TRINITY_DN59826_c0_g1_i1.p1  ORF type:complete len:228 (-),score=33.06 TRINITY_DN59826_c0_g1_i1:96-749(-)